MKGRFKHLCGFLLLLQPAVLPAQIAVSANDGKARPADSPNEPRTADSITILDLSSRPVRILATLHAPGSLVGPPGAVALTRDSRLALVASSTKLDASGAVVPDDTVSVIDLSRPSSPRVTQTLHAGAGASGVAINPAGTLALVASPGADSISVFAIHGGSVSPVGSVTLEPKSRPGDVAFSADGRTAYVAALGANSLLRLAIDGEKVERAGSIAVGAQPYTVALDRKSYVAFVNHLGPRVPSPGPGPKVGHIGVVDLRQGRMVAQVDTGLVPEYAGLSPSGRYLETTINNGTTAPASSPAHHDKGLMIVYRVRGTELTPAAQTETGSWCQGATWSNDERFVLLQCSARKQLEVYRFDGRSLTLAQTLQLDARPGAIATARSR